MADGIACWFIDTDYNEASFFVRHAYFLGRRLLNRASLEPIQLFAGISDERQWHTTRTKLTH